MEPLKIGLLSDSHRRNDLQESALAKLKEEGARYLLHAGDLCLEENLRRLKESGLPYAAVFGNNDRALASLGSDYRIRPEPYYFRIDGLEIKMMHLPHYLSPDCKLVVFGHTHRFSCERKGKTLYLNPGEVCGRETGNCHAVLAEYDDGRWTVRHFYRPIDHDGDWEEERRIFP
ncbi:YfcE family phosphodiesterase [Nitratifractor sp.]|uniref:YfcE family phosphodiesterase n=1 Tax=Nitratifractor sp. TaxID=2268144 RepID=UPI0025E7C952|nr:YfcE family phosphodiesterase [Nitratifractor sp.]